MADLQRQLMELRNEYEETNMKLRGDVDRLQQELEACIEQLRHLMDAKLSLELEICCYRQLLEGEENRYVSRPFLVPRGLQVYYSTHVICTVNDQYSSFTECGLKGVITMY